MVGAFLAIHARDQALATLISSRARVLHHLVSVFEMGKLVVLTRNLVSVAVGGDGVIVGSLFTRNACRHVTSLSQGAALAIAATGGDHLLNRFWGGYVAFIGGPRGDWSVIRDPSGQLPCFSRRVDGALLLASECELLFVGNQDRPSVDWSALGNHLTRISEPSRRTALVGVEEIHAGERLAVAGAMDVSQAWSPWDHVTPGVSGDLTAVETVVDDCCRTWAAGFDATCLTLSGGLDSSIVAASLAGHPGLTCLNFLTPTPDGDETRYAREVATHLDIALHIEPLDLPMIDLGRSTTARDPRPAGRMIGHATDAAAEALLGSSPRAALFNGEGGDNVFCFLGSPLPAIDRLLADGPGPGAWKSWRDTSQLTRTSLLRSGLWMLRRMSHVSKPPRWGGNHLFLATDIGRDGDPEPMPAWLSAPAGVAPGKVAHVRAICRAQVRKRRLPDGRPIVSPLVSQPIVEQVLAIPTWRWCEGGRDRTIARQAFAGRLPGSIIKRRSKGGPDGFALELVASRREELRSRLLEGVLASNGLIDRQAVADELSDAGMVQSIGYLRILELAEAEAWAAYWQAGGPSTLESLQEPTSSPASAQAPPAR